MTDPLLQELVAREIERTRKNSDPTIQRALDILGQDVNPVKVVPWDEVKRLYDEAGYPVTPKEEKEKRERLGAFRRPNDPNIYISGEAKEYRRAVKNPKDIGAALILAGILAHEQTHETEKGPDSEWATRRKESDFLQSKLETVPSYQRDSVRDRIRQQEEFLITPPRKVRPK
jgi:hypothetical protein